MLLLSRPVERLPRRLIRMEWPALPVPFFTFIQMSKFLLSTLPPLLQLWVYVSERGEREMVDKVVP